MAGIENKKELDTSHGHKRKRNVIHGPKKMIEDNGHLKEKIIEDERKEKKKGTYPQP